MRTLLLTVLCMGAIPTVARADDPPTVNVIVDAPLLSGAHATVLDRELPSGVAFKLHVAVPGTDPVVGSVLVWPDVKSNCAVKPDLGAKQRHEIGLTSTGTGDSRTLEAQIPPLQLGTHYCIQVTYDRRLTAEVLAAVTDAVANAPIDWKATCTLPDPATDVETRLATAITQTAAAFNLLLDSGRTRAAAQTITQIFNVESHCKKVVGAIQDVTDRAHKQQLAANALTQVVENQLCVPATGPCSHPSKVSAWPAAVVKNGTDYRVFQLKDASASDLSSIQSSLAGAPAVIVDPITELATAPAAKAAAAKAKLEKRPSTPIPLLLYIPATDRYVDLSKLAQTDPAGIAEAKQIRAAVAQAVKASPTIIIPQLQLMRTYDEQNVKPWIDALVTVNSASQAETDATKAVNDAIAARDAAVSSVATDLKAAVQTDTVKDLLKTTASEHVDAPSAKSTGTDDKGSWISPNIGVLAAAPFLERDGNHGFSSGFLEPYGGASIYFTRVDRVIDLDDLVGPVFWQRNSVLVGALLSKPQVNGKDINGPWSTSVVPVIGVGHRFTQYIRVDLGAIPFKYADANPVIVDSHWGVAFWIGASIDADVWAAVSGKLGR